MLERSPPLRRRARLGALVRRVLSWPARVAEARRTFALLAQMTDRELGDIGLLRSDLADCAALPLDADPSHQLAQRRAARAWFASGRSTAPRALAAVVERKFGRASHEANKEAEWISAEHGDQSLFAMGYPTNIRWTDQ